MNQLYYQLAALCSYIIGHLFSHRHLHVARFARLDEVSGLVCSTPSAASLLLGRTKLGHLLEIRATQRRPQVGNLLAVAQTRGGKGLLAISQLLSWRHSVIVNDIKGELFTKTAGQRAQWGPVYVVESAGRSGPPIRPVDGEAHGA